MEPTPYDSELKLIQQVALGEWVDFSTSKNSHGQPTASIRAALLRRMIFGIPLPPDYYNTESDKVPKPIETPNGVRLKGAIIEGTLDLVDGGRDAGGDCPALVLEDCSLPGDTVGKNKGVGIDARHVRMTRLELKNCRFSKLDLTGVELSGDFDFSGAKPFETGGDCQVVARDARIDGTVRGANAELMLNSIRSNHHDQTREYALDLKGSEIEGSVMLRPGFIAKGGVVVSNCKFSNDLWLDGAELISRHDAFSAQLARIDGVIVLREIKNTNEDGKESIVKFRASGNLNFYQANLGMADLSGAVLSSGAPWVFDAHMAEIRGDFLMNGIEAQGDIRLSNATIGGGIISQDAKFQSIYASNITVWGNITLAEIEAQGDIELSNATIGGDIISQGAKFQSIYAPDISVRGNVTLHEEISGEVNFEGARIEGHMALGSFGKKGRDRLALPLLVCANRKAQITFENSIIGQMKVAGIELKKPLVEDIPSERRTVNIEAIRTRALLCYPTKRLVEAAFTINGNAQGKKDNKHNGRTIVSLLLDPTLLDPTKSPIILSGNSYRIHKLNRETNALKLETKEEVEEYLRFFCANVWGEEGAFIIVDKKDVNDSVKNQTPPISVKWDADKQSWHTPTGVGVVYANHLFESKFRILQDGRVEMVEDKPLQEYVLKPPVVYSQPFRKTRDTGKSHKQYFDWPLTIPGDWSNTADPKTIQSIKMLLEGKSPEEQSALIRIKIDMRGAKVGYLNDGHGADWGMAVQLFMDGFIYDRVDTEGRGSLGKELSSSANSFEKDSDRPSAKHKEDERDICKERIRWLMKQYKDMEAGPSWESPFTPQPFDHLAKILRGSGLYKAADEVTIKKLQLERRVKFPQFDKKLSESELWSWLSWLVGIVFSALAYFAKPVVKFAAWLSNVLFDFCFKYGLSVPHALVTCIVFIAVGYCGVEFANYGYVRYPPWSSEEEQPPAWVPALLRATPLEKPILVVETTPVSTGVMQGQGPTGEVNKLVSPRAKEGIEEIPCREAVDSLWYAIDLAVPVLDLNQESKCEISSRADAWIWRVLEQAYAIMGALITSLTILTVSGVLRRHLSKSD